jgi:hypothetical protein
LPDDETAIRSVDVFRAMSCDALATPGAAANAVTTAASATAARRSGRLPAESGRAP